MRLYTIEINQCQQLAIENSDHMLYLLKELGIKYDDMNELICNISHVELEELNERIANNDLLKSLRGYNLNEVRICAPIPKPMRDIVCLGINYDEHIQEVGAKTEGYTVYFSKRVNEASGTLDKIPSYPGLVDSLDYEAELAVIIGKDTKGVSVEDALDSVFGYTIINDVSARNLQFRHQQWYLGKSLDGFSPMGPCIVTADELPEIQNLSITCTVNGEIRQSSNTCYMIQPVANAISELSQAMTLKTGTIIATGTPGGVAMGMKPPVFLKHGDEVVCKIERIGMIKNIVE
jgi:2-keto-4-pentenoate hydratase/2-oxohepta-3-ene-1,7-dioic acid hydratase in catechol pathway